MANTVDGKNLRHLGCQKPVNNGINYQPQLVIAGFLNHPRYHEKLFCFTFFFSALDWFGADSKKQFDILCLHIVYPGGGGFKGSVVWILVLYREKHHDTRKVAKITQQQHTCSYILTRWKTLIVSLKFEINPDRLFINMFINPSVTEQSIA